MTAGVHQYVGTPAVCCYNLRNSLLELQISPVRVVVRDSLGGCLALDVALQHLHIGSDEDKVNLGSLEGRYAAVIMEGVRSTCVMSGHVVGIVHLELTVDHRTVCLVVLCDVEITGHNGWTVAHNTLYLAHNQLGALLAGLYTYVVIVCVDGHENLSCSLVFQLHIACHTLESGIPAL